VVAPNNTNVRPAEKLLLVAIGEKTMNKAQRQIRFPGFKCLANIPYRHLCGVQVDVRGHPTQLHEHGRQKNPRTNIGHDDVESAR
jgi:hypothetical protein